MFHLPSKSGEFYRLFFYLPERPAARSARMSLDVNEQVRLEVSFCSDRPVRAETRILMCLEDNKHVTTTIQVIGEACQDVVSFHNINNLQKTDLDVDEGERRQGGGKKGEIGKRCLSGEGGEWCLPELWIGSRFSRSFSSR